MITKNSTGAKCSDEKQRSSAMVEKLLKMVDIPDANEDVSIETLWSSNAKDNMLINKYITEDGYGKAIESREETIIFSGDTELFRSSLLEDLNTEEVAYTSILKDINDKTTEYKKYKDVSSVTTTTVKGDCKSTHTVVTEGTNHIIENIIHSPNMFYETSTVNGDIVFMKRKLFDMDNGRIETLETEDPIESSVKTFIYTSPKEKRAICIRNEVTNKDTEAKTITLEDMFYKMDSEFEYQFSNTYNPADPDKTILEYKLKLFFHGSKSRYYELSDRGITYTDNSKKIYILFNKDTMDIDKFNATIGDDNKSIDIYVMIDTLGFTYSNTTEGEDYLRKFKSFSLLTHKIDMDEICEEILKVIYPGFDLKLNKVKDIYTRMLWRKENNA